MHPHGGVWMAYTTDDLISAIKISCFLPSAQITFTDGDILHLGDDEILSSFAPLLVSLNQNIYLESVTTPFVTGQSRYVINKYAMWNKLRRVDRLVGANVVKLDHIEVDELPYYSQSGTPRGFYLDNDSIIIVPTPVAAGDSLYYWIYRRPGRMVMTSAAAKVLSINYVTGQVTYTAAPPATFTSTSTHDFYAGRSPFRRVGTEVTATNLAANVHTFPAAAVAGLLPNDYVCVVEETVFPPLTAELHPFLQDAIIAAMNKAQLDPEAYTIQKQELMEKTRNAYTAPGNRTVGQPRKVSCRKNPFIGHTRYSPRIP